MFCDALVTLILAKRVRDKDGAPTDGKAAQHKSKARVQSKFPPNQPAATCDKPLDTASALSGTLYCFGPGYPRADIGTAAQRDTGIRAMHQH